MVKLKRNSGNFHPRVNKRRHGSGKLSTYANWFREQIGAGNDITLHELSQAFKATFGLRVHSTSIGRFLRKLGLSHKKRRFLHVSNNEPM